MLPGRIQIHDLNGAGEVLVGQIPNPDSPVSDDHFEGGPFPASAPSLGIDAEAELFGSFDGAVTYQWMPLGFYAEAILVTNVTDDDPQITARIARAHLNEFADYYTRLERMEEEAKRDWGRRD